MKPHLLPTTQRLTALAGLTFVAAVLAPPTEAATLTYENDWNYIVPSSGVVLSGTNYFASTNDLANNGQATLLSAVWSGGTNGIYDSSPAQLNNGLYAPAFGPDPAFVDAAPTDSTLLATTNTTYTITFSGGMDITSVDVYSAMTGTERAKQNWSLEYRLAGQVSYQLLVDPFLPVSVAQNSNGNRQGAWFNKVTLTPGAGELLNVESLRFTFLEPVYFAPTDGANSVMLETGYREIDVFGSPSPVSAYDAWAVSYGLDPAVPSGPNAGAPSADPDGDTFANGLEFAFGTVPVVGTGSLTHAAGSGGLLTVAWLERVDGTVTYGVKEATNLSTGPWMDWSGVPGTPGTPAPAGYVWKQISVPTTSGRAFYHVAATY